jgi:hypothetical protein
MTIRTGFRAALCVAGALALSGLGACSSAPKGAVSEKELAETRATQQSLRLGQAKDDALSQFKHGNVLRLSSARISGVDIEEWKVEAFNDDNSKKSRELFVSFLYFANGKLVDIRDTRADYTRDAEIVRHWSGGSK